MSDAAQRAAQRIHRSTGQRCRHLMRDVRAELAALARWHERHLTARVRVEPEVAQRVFLDWLIGESPVPPTYSGEAARARPAAVKFNVRLLSAAGEP